MPAKPLCGMHLNSPPPECGWFLGPEGGFVQKWSKATQRCKCLFKKIVEVLKWRGQKLSAGLLFFPLSGKWCSPMRIVEPPLSSDFNPWLATTYPRFEFGPRMAKVGL